MPNSSQNLRVRLSQEGIKDLLSGFIFGGSILMEISAEKIM
ncbi:protein of unknown function [Pseudomonas mediterranea]